MFSDDDLKRLKVEGLRFGDISSEDFRALLARLEAAEKVCDLINSKAWVNVTQELKAWRKASGKGE